MKLDGKKRREKRKWERVQTLDAQNGSYSYIMGRAGGVGSYRNLQILCLRGGKRGFVFLGCKWDGLVRPISNIVGVYVLGLMGRESV